MHFYEWIALNTKYIQKLMSKELIAGAQYLICNVTLHWEINSGELSLRVVICCRLRRKQERRAMETIQWQGWVFTWGGRGGGCVGKGGAGWDQYHTMLPHYTMEEEINTIGVPSQPPSVPHGAAVSRRTFCNFHSNTTEHVAIGDID